MKAKTFMTMAVASTFGLSAAAFAGSGHEVMTPLSVNETGEVFVSQHKGFGSTERTSAVNMSSLEPGMGTSDTIGSLIGSLSGADSAGSGLFDSGEAASLSLEESLALADDGVYSDFYIVSSSPMTFESWDYYIVDTDSLSVLAALDEPDVLMPTHELALVASPSDETIYELVLVPTSFEWMSDVSDYGAGE